MRKRLPAIVITALAAAALVTSCVSEEEPDGTAGPVDQYVADPQCLERIGTEFPAQHPTPASSERVAELTRILCGNEAAKSMLAGRETGRDYWARVSYVYEYREARNSGEKPIAMVRLYFDPPLSFAGEVPAMSHPCSGHYGPNERLDPDDPCMTEPREYWTEHKTFSNVQVVVAQVDFRRGEVVEVFAAPVGPADMADIRSQYGQ